MTTITIVVRHQHRALRRRGDSSAQERPQNDRGIGRGKRETFITSYTLMAVSTGHLRIPPVILRNVLCSEESPTCQAARGCLNGQAAFSPRLAKMPRMADRDNNRSTTP